MMSRSFIEQAKGILIERPKITEDEAFTMLTHASNGTRWTNRELLFHMLFGYLIVRTPRGSVGAGRRCRTLGAVLLATSRRPGR